MVLSREEFLDAIREQFTISENASPEPPKRGHWSMYLGGKWYGLQHLPQPLCQPALWRCST